MLPTHRKPTLPGKILLEEFLIPLGITQPDFALYLGGTWTEQKPSAIIRGERAITEEIALDLAGALGASPEFWVGLQMDVSLWDAKQKCSEASD
ncbi:MAG: HigA family addiction module antitoxin [Chlamydiota bacterium]